MACRMPDGLGSPPIVAPRRLDITGYQVTLIPLTQRRQVSSEFVSGSWVWLGLPRPSRAAQGPKRRWRSGSERRKS